MQHLINTMKKIKGLKNGVGVKQLLDEASKILDNPIVMFNTEYNLLAHTEITTDDPIWNEIITNGTFSKETQTFFDNEGFIEEIANASRVATLKSKKLKYDRLSGKIFNKNNSYVSNLVITACNRPFEKDDLILFESVCRLISKEISKSDFYQEYEQNHQETIIKKLIEGTYDIKLDLAQIGTIYDSLESNLYVTVIHIPKCQLKHNIKYFRDLFKQIKPMYKYAIYYNYIIIIVSTNDNILNVNNELKEIIKILNQNNMNAGISSRFENLFEFKKYYEEAIKSLEYVIKCKCSQKIFPYNATSINTVKQIESLENGMGIQYFLNKGLEIFGNPLLFHDMEPNLLGYTENVEIADPIWQELITYGTGSDETIELFRTEGWVDIMDNTKGGALLISDKCKYDRISWRIYNSDNIRFGCTSIVNTMKPFSEDELVLFGIFSQKFSKEVKKIEFYNKIGQVYSETIINRLISGKIDNYAFYSDDIGNLYDDFMENLYLIALDTSQCDLEHGKLAYFRKLFNWPGVLNRYAIYENYIIIILSINNNHISENSEFEEISKIFEKKNIYAGISSKFENIYELQTYYLEAVEALKLGLKKKNIQQRIFYYNKKVD